jgi:hypothetical protein
MNQVQVSLSLEEVYFDVPGKYQVTFQHQYSTEIAEIKNTKFENKQFDIITSTEADDTIILHALIEDYQSGKPVIKAKTAVQIHQTSNVVEKEIVFTEGITGFLLVKLSTLTATSGQIIRTLHDKDYVLNVVVGYLNSLVETVYTLRVTVLTESLQHLGSFQLNNNFYHSVSKIAKKYGSDGLRIRIEELRDTGDAGSAKEALPSLLYTVSLSNGSPSVIYITLASGDILTVSLKLSDVEHHHLVGIIHSSVMREGSINADPQHLSTPRMSLTPRRKSTMIGTAGINISPRASFLRSGTKLPGSLKQILFLEDESISKKPTSVEEILHKLGKKLEEEGNEDNTSVSKENNNTFIFSTSKTDVMEELEGDDHNEGRGSARGSPGGHHSHRSTKHMKRKDMQNIVLGVFKLDRSFFTNPLKLRATLIDVTFEEKKEKEKESTGDDDEENQLKPNPIVKFSGYLGEVSREVFAESGLTTCALEGKLNIPNSKLSGVNILPISELAEGYTERIMVFKVILSLISFEGFDEPIVPVPAVEVNKIEEGKEEDEEVEEKEVQVGKPAEPVDDKKINEKAEVKSPTTTIPPSENEEHLKSKINSKELLSPPAPNKTSTESLPISDSIPDTREMIRFSSFYKSSAIHLSSNRLTAKRLASTPASSSISVEGESKYYAVTLDMAFPIPSMNNDHLTEIEIKELIGFSYFEIQLVSLPSSSSHGVVCGLGMIESNKFPMEGIRLLGWDSGSYGYHSDDGLLYGEYKVDGISWRSWKQGDIIGCGIDYYRGVLFYTRNGILLGDGFKLRLLGEALQQQQKQDSNMDSTQRPSSSSQISSLMKLIPCFTMKGEGIEISLNTGQQPFKFIDKTYVKGPLNVKYALSSLHAEEKLRESEKMHGSLKREKDEKEEEDDDDIELRKNRTGELDGFSESFEVNTEVGTVEDVINRRFSKLKLNKKEHNSLLNEREMEENKQNISLFLKMLKDELLEKQRMIEELTQENKEKYNAIQECGKEIKILRNDNHQFQVRHSFLWLFSVTYLLFTLSLFRLFLSFSLTE